AGPAAASGPALAAAQAAQAEAQAAAARAAKAEGDLKDLTGKLQQAQIDPANLPDLAQWKADAEKTRQAPAGVDRLTKQPAEARAAAEAARDAQARLDALIAQLRQAQLDPADLPAALRRLAEGAAKAAEGQLARLRDQLAQAAAETRAAEDR